MARQVLIDMAQQFITHAVDQADLVVCPKAGIKS